MAIFGKIEDLKAWLIERGNPDTIVLEDEAFLRALVGISHEGRLVYAFDEMVIGLMERDGMDMEEAAEFIEYNTLPALRAMGPKAPHIMYYII